MRKKVLMDALKSHFSTSCPASSADVMALMGQGGISMKSRNVRPGHIADIILRQPSTAPGL